MTDAISHQARLAQANSALRSAVDKTDKKAPASQAGADETKVAIEKKDNVSDSVSLSNVNQRIKDQPAFDRSKIDAIKDSIKNGNYPLNPRRIAENFVAIEQMIQG